MNIAWWHRLSAPTGSSTTAPGRRSDGDGARMFSPHPWPSKFAARQDGPICAWSSGNVARVTAEHNGGSWSPWEVTVADFRQDSGIPLGAALVPLAGGDVQRS